MEYRGSHTKEISFPLGGIGTGSIGLGGNGRLLDWEIFNRPAKGTLNGYSHFAVKALQNGKPITYILHGDLQKDLMGQYRQTTFSGYGFGPQSQTMCGFPHFSKVSFQGEFPIADLHFSDPNFPGEVRLTAFNPMIPGDADNSSLPAAFFEVQITNSTPAELSYQVACSIANPFAVSRNLLRTENGTCYLTLQNADPHAKKTELGDLTVATDCDTVYPQTYWYRGEWQDAVVTYWNDFHCAKPLQDRTYDTAGSKDTGTLAAQITVGANETKSVRFLLTWNIPNQENYWSPYLDANGEPVTWKNYYATLFTDSLASARYALTNWKMLYRRTDLFRKTLHGATLPPAVIDAAASNLSVLKSPTVLRLEDGSFYGWEGVHEREGSCEGTCQHVWNYAYAMCFLFPSLERSIRESEQRYCTAPDGRTGFRMLLPAGRDVTEFRACVDGQMGCVLKCYREWKLSGDTDWLRARWDWIKQILEYAWSSQNPDGWDADRDGVLEGRQHHTLDMELFGPSAWLESMYLAALKAAAEMADFLADTQKAAEYRALFQKGQAWTTKHLFNGTYFIQKIDLTDRSLTDRFGASDTYWNSETGEIKYQIGEGSSIDQLLGQWHADLLGLGDILDPTQVECALAAMMQNHYKPTMRTFANPWRIFSLNDEAGSVICDYPEGAQKPKIPIPYCEETMTGFEYSFAGLLLSRKKTAEGFTVVRAVRDRFDGEKRNPWNEFECGSNYARSMASYALLPILSGFSFDLPHGYIGFAPYETTDFRCVFSLEGAWGEFRVKDGEAVVSVAEGKLTLSALGLSFCSAIKALYMDQKPCAYTFTDGVLRFEKNEIQKEIRVRF